ncbi:hypothetical protein BVY01_03925 [bacterium I07]|nr:hypothetical protein BVY01_03925 [bacterium I07]
MYYAGIDAGSRAIKVVLLNGDGSILNTGIANQGVRQTDLAATLFERLLEEKGIRSGDITGIVATGYGRDSLEFVDKTITEISCHAKGVHSLHPEARTIIDIGGQDSKVIRLDENGNVRDFVMNDRCAAGTGRFLEVMAERLELKLDQIGHIAKKSDHPASISSMCVVFAESEIIGLLASGERVENIISGVQNAIAKRISSMIGRRADIPVYFTGGVALIPGMDAVLHDVLNLHVHTSIHPQLTGALGAALLARQT